MWLDRLSANSTPNQSSVPVHNRPYSPAPPRRPSHLAPQPGSYRGFSPRSSSLSLHSNESTTSLLSSSRKVNGSNLRQSAAVPAYPEPIEVLEKLLGSGTRPTDQPPQDSEVDVQGDGDFDEHVDFNGLSLHALALSAGENVDSVVYRPQTVEECMCCSTQTMLTKSNAKIDERDKERFEDLHKSIRACDDVLRSVEQNLTSFQHDLGAVSAEIETLQSRSTALSIRLENRRVVEKGLGPIIEEITVSPAVVRKIAEGTIDEAWVRALAEVEKRSKALDAKSKEHYNIKGVADLKPLLENLVNKALERIRDHLVAQIKALRSPNINAQIIQQQHFLRYKDLYAFLHRHHTQLAEEIAQAYLNTMRWYYLNQFTRYLKALEKVKVHTIDKADLLGADDGSRRTSTLLSSSKSSGTSHDAFNLGRRIELLRNSTQTALPSYLAEEDKTVHYLEYPFRHFNLALIDNASAEYAFLSGFFSPSLKYATISRHFNYIFEPTFTLGYTLTRSLISETFDCLGILLCVRLNQHLAFELQRRKIPAVDGYINGTSMLLWPRFQVVMDQHCESLRRMSASLASVKPPNSRSEQAKQSAAPHFLTQRFGQFLQGILALSTEAGDDEPVSSSLGRLRSEMEALLAKLGKGIGEARKRERFMYNNYSLVATIIADIEGGMGAEQTRHFEELKKAFEGGS